MIKFFISQLVYCHTGSLRIITIHNYQNKMPVICYTCPGSAIPIIIKAMYRLLYCYTISNQYGPGSKDRRQIIIGTLWLCRAMEIMNQSLHFSGRHLFEENRPLLFHLIGAGCRGIN